MFCKQLTHVIDLFYAVRENIPSIGQKDWKILSFCRKKIKKLYSSHAHRPNQSSFSNVIEKPQSIIKPSSTGSCNSLLTHKGFILRSVHCQIAYTSLHFDIWLFVDKKCVNFFTKYSLVTWRSTNKKSLPWFAEITCSAQSLVPSGFHINQAVNFLATSTII